MSRPSDGFTFDELREEFDWIYEFQSRMAERIREDADVHNLVDYVRKLERSNEWLQAAVEDSTRDFSKLADENADLRREIALNEPLFETLNAANDALLEENAELRELVRDMYEFVYECQLGCEQYLATFDAEHATYDESTCNDCWMKRRMRELGIEVDE